MAQLCHLGLFQALAFFSGNALAGFTSVERMRHIAESSVGECEASLTMSSAKWPSEASLALKGIVAAYQDHPPVLTIDTLKYG